MVIFLYFLVGLTAGLLPVFGFLGLITLAALWRGPGPQGMREAAARTRFLVVIPAHDEEGTVGETVASCRAVDYDSALYSIYVIADNCSDGTAREAREAGAVVIERSDPERRSKGHALEYFFENVPEARPGGGYDAAVLIDADTLVDPAILKTFAASLAEGKDWLQAYYTVSNPDASWRTRMLTYAFSLFNGVWLAGEDALGLSIPLRGNGMCFSQRGLARVPWRAYGLTEDLEFSWTLRLAGERVHFASGTRVFGEMVSRGSAAAGQRRRWEAGRRELRAKILRPLLSSNRFGRYTQVLYLADLLFPPFSTLLLSLIAALGIHVAPFLDARAAAISWALLPIHILMIITLAAYALAPKRVVGLPFRYFGSLIALPYYIAWKCFVSATGRPTLWLRTRRESRAEQSAR